MSAKLGLAIPSLRSVAESDAFLAPCRSPEHTPLYLKLIPRIRVAQPPRSQKFTHIVDDEISKVVQFGLQSPEGAASAIRKRWLSEFRSPLYNDL